MKKFYFYLNLILFVVFLAFFTFQVSILLNTPINTKPELVAQIGHTFITNLALSPDQKLMFSAGSDGVLKLWDIKTKREIRTFDEVQGNEIDSFTTPSIAFSPDGKTVLSSSRDKTLKLFDIATGYKIRTLKGHYNANWLSPNKSWYNKIFSVAFSPNGQLALSSSRDGTIKLWNLKTAHEIHTFKGHSSSVLTAIFSPDGRTILSGGEDNTLKLWDIKTGLELKTFKGHSAGIVAAKFSSNGLSAFSASLDNTVKLWNIETGNEIRTIISLDRNYRLNNAVFSPSGERALLLNDYQIFHDSFDRISSSLMPENSPVNLLLQVELWDLKTGQKIFTIDRFPPYAGNPQPITAIALSPDGKIAISNVTEVIKIWNLDLERKIYTDNLAKYYYDHEFMKVKGTVWDITPDQEFGRYLYTAIPYRYHLVSYSISPENHILLSNGDTLKFWNTEERKLMTFQEPSDDRIIDVSFSPDGKIALSASAEGIVKLWEVSSGHEICSSVLSNHPQTKMFEGELFEGEELQIRPDVQKIIFSSDGSKVALGVCNNSEVCSDEALAILWDVTTCSEAHIFLDNMADDISSLLMKFSPNSRYLLLVRRLYNTKIQLWDIAKNQAIINIPIQACRNGKMPTVGFSSDSRIVYYDCEYERMKLWNVATGQQISEPGINLNKADARINNVSSTKSVSISGVNEKGGGSIFQVKNTQTGEELAQLIFFTEDNWAVVAPSGQYNTNNPGDLPGISWVMPDDPLTPLPVEIFMKEYFEPSLLPQLLRGKSLPPIKSVAELNRVQPKIEIVQITPNRDNPALVSVTIKVAGNQKDFQREGKIITQTTGVHDLRLFRDDHSVVYAPKTGGEIKLDPVTNNTELTFKNIRLPRKKGIKQVEFSAHAFNDDGVKSSTVRKTYTLPKNLQPRKGNVYLISIGVNAYENPAWDLNFAANDARAIPAVLSKKIAAAQSNYAAIVPITLISEYQYQQGQRILTSNQATKPIIQALFNKLAGQIIEPTLLAGIPNADKLQTAQPEDILLLSFSSHGHADNKGNFYLFPYDIGPGNNKEITESLLSHTISSEELSLWLRDVDAGDMVMIIDACHSAASVEGEGFKPGPMGSRGLGQLAYDKGMRILTASQADDIALEHDELEHGFLTYSLIQDGIQAGKADWKPQDLQIMLGEWLQYGEKRVPELYAEVRNGKLKTYNRGRVIREEKELSSSSRFGQQPSLFDFTKHTEDVVVARPRQ
jgi:WD40 repeat protein